MDRNFRQRPKWHCVIAVKTGNKRLILARLHDLSAVASIVDDGPYPDDASISRLHVISRFNEDEMRTWLFEHCLEHLRLSVQPIGAATQPDGRRG